MDISVGRLAEDDAEVFREIRLDALDRHPEAFQATYERSAELPLEAFAARLERYPLMRHNVVILGTPYGTFPSFTANCCMR